MDVEGIDHVVFTVRDIATTCDFYARVLGVPAITFDDGRCALQIGRCKINLHQVGHEFEPRAAEPRPGTQDICLISTSPLADVVSQVRSAGAGIIEGPVPRTGARGAMKSIYVRDPDGNLIEIACYPTTMG